MGACQTKLNHSIVGCAVLVEFFEMTQVFIVRYSESVEKLASKSLLTT